MSGTKTLVQSWDKSSLETFSDLRHFRPSDISSPETFFSKKWNFPSEKHAIECKWGCNHHKCAKLFLRCSAHHALASKKKILGPEILGAGNVFGPDLSYGQKCHGAGLVSGPDLSKYFEAELVQSRSVSRLEVSKSLGQEVSHGRRYLGAQYIFLPE